MIKVKNAQEAFEHLYAKLNRSTIIFSKTKAEFNCGFLILNPLDNKITTPWRKWNEEYAEYEWQWYLSGNPNGEDISKIASIWKNHMDENGDIRSNYGWQWDRNNQLKNVIQLLKSFPDTRQAVLSLYDGKEISTYGYDTPCTNSIHFQIVDNKLCMTVNMRSNDVWFGFCNDQYCFSKLQEMISKELSIETGWYYHFASNMHLYEQHFNKNLKQ